MKFIGKPGIFLHFLLFAAVQLPPCRAILRACAYITIYREVYVMDLSALGRYNIWLQQRDYSPATIRKYVRAAEHFFRDTGSPAQPRK